MKTIESSVSVLKQAVHVSINKDKVRWFARNFNRNKLEHWLSISPFNLNQLKEVEKIGFLFSLDSISFCYWGNPKWKVEYYGKEYDGTQAMMACLGRVIENGKTFTPNYLARMQRNELENILQGNIEIPLLDERLRNLNEIGAVVQKKFKGDFRYVVDQSRYDSSRLVDLLVREFSSFEDSAIYRGKEIEFNKRAQLLASDINQTFGKLEQSDKLTACADYKLPQVLRRYEILQYSDELQKRISTGKEIPKGSEEEVEIRAHTIYAVELIKAELTEITSNQINDYLWLEGQIKLPTDEPYHLTRTTAY